MKKIVLALIAVLIIGGYAVYSGMIDVPSFVANLQKPAVTTTVKPVVTTPVSTYKVTMREEKEEPTVTTTKATTTAKQPEVTTAPKTTKKPVTSQDKPVTTVKPIVTTNTSPITTSAPDVAGTTKRTRPSTTIRDDSTFTGCSGADCISEMDPNGNIIGH